MGYKRTFIAKMEGDEVDSVEYTLSTEKESASKAQEVLWGTAGEAAASYANQLGHTLERIVPATTIKVC